MNRKYIIIAAISVIAIGASVFGYYRNHRTNQNIITYNNPSLTDAEAQQFKSKISELEGKLKESNLSDEERYRILVDIGSQYVALGEYKTAKDSYLKAKNINPEMGTAWVQLFTVETAMRDYDAAEESIKKVLTLAPNAGQYWLSYIELLRFKKYASDYDVQKAYTDAVRETGNSSDILVSYARYLEEKNDLVGAVQQWKQAIDFNPGNRELYETEIRRIQSKLQ